MPLAVLPERNTFIHFQEQGLDALPMDRSATCPGSFVPLARADSNVWIPPATSSLDADCAAVGGRSPLNMVPLAPPVLIPQTSEAHEEDSTLMRTKTFEGSSFATVKAPWSRSSVTHTAVVAAESTKTSASSCTIADKTVKKATDLPNTEVAVAQSIEKKRWADLSDDEQSTVCQTPRDESPRCQETVAIQDTNLAHEKRRWAELSEDESTSLSAPAEADVGEFNDNDAENFPDQQVGKATSEPDAKQKTDETLAKHVTLRRPQFVRPTRESRSHQLRVKLNECFELDFDAVDPSQQDGLTHRMLVTLKSLGETVNFWQPDGEQLNEEAFKLVGLEEEDMYSLGRVIRKADKLLESRRFREAYENLCKARRWFDPQTLEEERAKARARTSEPKSHKSIKAKKVQEDAEIDGWSEVTQKKSKKSVRSSSKNETQPVPAKAAQVEERRETATKSPYKAAAQSANTTQTQKARNGHQKTTVKAQKFLCRYLVGIEQNRSFNVVRKLLGDHGSHMKAIAESTGAKLRIRGRGSGFKEGPENVEADEPLMICVSATSSEGFDDAAKDVESLLMHAHDQYYAFCSKHNLPHPKLIVARTEQPSVAR